MELFKNFVVIILDFVFSPVKLLNRLINSKSIWSVLFFPLTVLCATTLLSLMLKIPPYVQTADTLVHRLIIDEISEKNFPVDIKSLRTLSAFQNSDIFLRMKNNYFENNPLKKLYYLFKLNDTNLLPKEKKSAFFFDSSLFSRLDFMDKYSILSHALYLDLITNNPQKIIPFYHDALINPGSTILQYWLEYELNLRYSEDVIAYIDKNVPELREKIIDVKMIIEKEDGEFYGIISELSLFFSVGITTLLMFFLYFGKISIKQILGVVAYLAAFRILSQFFLMLVLVKLFPNIPIHAVCKFAWLFVFLLMEILLFFPVPKVLGVHRIKFFLLINFLIFSFTPIKNFIIN